MPAAMVPAPEVLEWIQEQLLAHDGAIHNPDHAHLNDADLAVLEKSERPHQEVALRHEIRVEDGEIFS